MNKNISVLIVDDEVLARVGIKSLINWEELGCSVIGEAENGEKALELIRKFRPELILTDINMPLMDGLELIKRVKDEGILSEFIILSSHDNFSYAREAIKLGARDYILKLEMKRDSLKETVKSVMPFILQNRKKQVDTGTTADESLNINIETMLRKVILSEYSEDFDKYIEPITSNIYCIYLRTVSIKGKVYSPDEKSALKTPILNLLEDILTDYKNGLVCSIRPMEFVILYSPDLENNNLRESNLKNKELVSSILETLKNYLNLTGLLGVSGPAENAESVNKLYREAREKIEQYYIYPGGSVLSDFKYSAELKTLTIDYKKDLETFSHRIHQLDFLSASEILSKFIKLFHNKCKVEKGVLKIICYQIIGSLKLYAAKEMKKQNSSIQRSLDSLSTLEEFIKWFQDTKDILSQLTTESSTVSPMILKALKLIENHYMEELTLTDLAEYLELSTGYFSQQFKKELGKNYTDYLADFRTSHASELLLNTDKPVHKIAEEVGYDNIYYFSRVFKSRTGLSPREFRKSYINN
ncbi:MAG: response regulator [Spirochaetaceae bacterium]